ncbi:MAG: RDD family protein [Nocardioides sp.]
MTSLPPEPPDDRPTDATPPPPPPPPAPAYGQPAYGQPAYGSTPMPVSGGGTPGGLLDRFLARLVDSILVGIVNFVVTTVIIVGVVMGSSASGLGGGASYGAAAVAALLGTAISLGYFSYLESSRGQTLGKMLMKLRTVGPGGGNPTMEQALRRNSYLALGLLGLIPVIGWIASLASVVAIVAIAVTINGDPVNRQGWHDHFAGETRVLKIG